MNFHHKLALALITLNEAPLDGAIEAALDEYADRYDGNIARIAAHLVNDLRNHYLPQIDDAIRSYSNVSGSLSQGPKNITNRYLDLMYGIGFDGLDERETRMRVATILYRVGQAHVVLQMGRDSLPDDIDPTPHDKLVELTGEIRQYLNTTQKHLGH